MFYTERVDGFQITDPTYFTHNGLPLEPTPPTFDIVKWEQHKPMKVTAVNRINGKWVCREEISTEHCYVVAALVWDRHEWCFDFNSVGLRWLEARPTETVIQMVLDFAEKKGKEIYGQEEYE